MKNSILLLISWFISLSLYAQVPTGSLTASWTENEKNFYILNDYTAPEDVNQVDRAQMQPKFYSQDVRYRWTNGQFAERAVTIHNYLGADGYSSFPVTTIKYSPDGAVTRHSLNGTLIEQISPPHAGLAADLADSKIQNVSPVFTKPVNYTFVPQLTISQLDSLSNAGYAVINQFPEYLEITGQGQKIIFDNHSKTRSYLLNDELSKLSSWQTDYFTVENEHVYKTRSVRQQFVTLVSGLCVIKAKEILYAAYSLSTTGNNNNLMQLSGSELTQFDNPVSVFPNPTSSSFTLNINDDKYLPRNVRLYDINGQEVPFTSNTDVLGNITISPQHAVTGMLLLRYELNNKLYTQKILKF